MKQISNKVLKLIHLPYKKLFPFQGNLKTLHKDDYEKMRDEILELGFSEPISAWYDAKSRKHYVLNGHQRLRTVSAMVEQEGYSCPDLPVITVEADSYQQAKLKVLALASQYGKISEQGLYEFLTEAKINPIVLQKKMSFPEINVGKFYDNFYNDKQDKKEEEKDSKGEDLEKNPSTVVHTCPRCQYKFQ